MVDPFIEYTIDNVDFINMLKAEYYDNAHLAIQNPSKSLYDRMIGHSRNKGNPTGPHCSFWEERIDFFNYLNEVTYPRDPDYVISYTWMRYYEKGCFSAFHLDEHESAGHVVNQITNVIMIDRSDDLIGGHTVIAGDSFRFDPQDPNRVGDLRERLITRDLRTPGQAISWNEKLVHGISRIERGHRLVFMTTKVHKSKYE